MRTKPKPRKPWRVDLFDWQDVDSEPFLRMLGTYKDYTARVLLGNNTQYTWIVDYPGGKAESPGMWANETMAMLLADMWLYKHLNPNWESENG
jgi:hypothetical protein